MTLYVLLSLGFLLLGFLFGLLLGFLLGMRTLARLMLSKSPREFMFNSTPGR